MRRLLISTLAATGLALSISAAFADGNPPDFRDVQTWPMLPPGKSAAEAMPGQIAEPAQSEPALPVIHRHLVRSSDRHPARTSVGVSHHRKRIDREERGSQAPHM